MTKGKTLFPVQRTWHPCSCLTPVSRFWTIGLSVKSLKLRSVKWLLHMQYNSMPLLVSPTFNVELQLRSSISEVHFFFFISLLCRPWSVLPFTWCGLKWMLSIRRQLRFLFQNIKHLHYISAFIVCHFLSQLCHTAAAQSCHELSDKSSYVALFPTLL